jgi:hypothetical protein
VFGEVFRGADTVADTFRASGAAAWFRR